MVTLRLFLLLARTTQNGCTRVELSQKVFLCPMMLAPKSDLLHSLAFSFRLCFYPLLFASSWFWFSSLDGNKLFLVAQAIEVAWPTGFRVHYSCNYLRSESLHHSPDPSLHLYPQAFSFRIHLQAHYFLWALLPCCHRSYQYWDRQKIKHWVAYAAWGQYTAVQLWSLVLIKTYLEERSKNKCIYLTALLGPT